MSINHRRIALGVLVALVWSLSACRGNDSEQAAQPSRAKGFLWQATSGKAVVYMLGVIHVGNERFYPLSEAIVSAFEDADTLVFETKIDKESQKKLHEKLVPVGMYPHGETLEQHLSDEVRQLYQSYIKRAYVDPNSLSHFRPWLVAWLVTMNEARRLGYSYDQGLAMHFFKRAEGQKRVLGLETPDDYAALFRALPRRVQEALLKTTLADIDQLPQRMEEMLTVWRKGDAKVAEKVMIGFFGRAELKPFFQNDRNKRMTSKIAQYLSTDRTYFVVVGAGHLVGKGGIVELLREKGYLVRRL